VVASPARWAAALLIGGLWGVCLGADAAAGGAPARRWKDVTVSFSGERLRLLRPQEIDGKQCLVSDAIVAPVGWEQNHHRVTVDFTGGGSVEVSVAHSSGSDLGAVLKAGHLRPPFRAARSGRELLFSSPYKGESCAWVLLRASGDVSLQSVRYTAWRAKGTLYGHEARTFEFAGAKLPYRIMYPRNFDPQKSYPLVLSVSGSGGVGSDNAGSMEMVILARYLFTRYYFDDELACFSVVPQIPPAAAVPAPYFPRGTRGAPSEFHPDWPAVNAGGFYVEATGALLRELLADKSLRVDPRRVYYSGFSYGGKACWEFLKADPDLWAGAICGAGWPIGRAFSEPKGDVLARLKIEAQRYKHVPVRIYAGELDGMKLGSRAVDEVLRGLGGDSRYVEFPKTAHVQTAERIWGVRDNVAWLFRQKRAKAGGG